MPEIPRKLKVGDREIAVTEVQILRRSGEGLAEYELEDGSLIRVGNVAAVVYRVDGQFDNEGNPLYLVKIGTSVTTISSAESAR